MEVVLLRINVFLVLSTDVCTLACCVVMSNNSDSEHGHSPVNDFTSGETPNKFCRSFVPETSPTKDVGWKLREALKQQLAIIHERVESKKLAKLALAEVRQLLAKEEEEKELDLGRKEITARVRERVAARLKEEEEKMEKDETEKALEKLRNEKAKPLDEKKEEESKEEKGVKKGGEKEEMSEKKVDGEGKKAHEEDKEKGKESGKEKTKKSRADKSDKGGKKLSQL